MAAATSGEEQTLPGRLSQVEVPGPGTCSSPHPGLRGGGWCAGGGGEGVNHVWTGTSSQSRDGMGRPKCGGAGSLGRGRGAASRTEPVARSLPDRLETGCFPAVEAVGTWKGIRAGSLFSPTPLVPGLVLGTGKPMAGHSLPPDVLGVLLDSGQMEVWALQKLGTGCPLNVRGVRTGLSGLETRR